MENSFEEYTKNIKPKYSKDGYKKTYRFLVVADYFNDDLIITLKKYFNEFYLRTFISGEEYIDTLKRCHKLLDISDHLDDNAFKTLRDGIDELLAVLAQKMNT